MINSEDFQSYIPPLLLAQVGSYSLALLRSQSTSTTLWARVNTASVAGLMGGMRRAPRGPTLHRFYTQDAGESTARMPLGQRDDHVAFLEVSGLVNIHGQVPGLKPKAAHHGVKPLKL